jgi:hypothetical protein
MSSAASATEGSVSISFLLIIAIVVAAVWLAVRRATRRSGPPPASADASPPTPPIVSRVAQNLAHLPEQQAQRGADRVQDSEYLHSSRWDELLTLRDGMPPLYLAERDGEWWLREDTTGLLVNVANRKLWKMGIWTVAVRGVDYHRKAARMADLSPGAPVALVREHTNKHDQNAVAICAAGTLNVIGYFNKGMAPRLSRLLDTGVDLPGVSMAGEGAGVYSGQRVRIVAAPPDVLEHLMRFVRAPI